MTAEKEAARFIVRACNAHEELLEVCKAIQQWGLKGQMPDGRWPFDLLRQIAGRITGEVPGVVSVTYNIGRKPPSTIEAF